MEYMLYASDKQPQVLKAGKNRKRSRLGAMPPTTIRTDWRRDVPILVRAMVLAGETLILAGPADLFDERKTQNTLDTPETQKLLAKQVSILEGSEGAILWAVSIADGQKLTEQKLNGLPVFDGMIAAGGRLYYATIDGRVICLGSTR